MKFPIPLKIVALNLIFIAVLFGQATASEMEDAGVLIAMELKALSQSVDRLTKLIEDKSDQTTTDDELRKLEIAIAYLNFRSRRIEMFERDLQTMKAQRNRIEDILEQFEREEDNLPRSFDSSQQEALQRAQNELTSRKQSFKDRISRMDEEIILLENRIMDMRSQIDSVESFVEKNLAF